MYAIRSYYALLVKHFLDKLHSIKTINHSGLELLQNYPWPGNIRELENLIERLHVISKENEIPANLIARYLSSANGATSSYENLPLEKAMYAFEKNLIQDALKRADGVKT